MNIQSRTEIGQDTIRVMLVDDDDRIQQALRLAIETHPELNLVGQAYTLKDAMAVVEELQPEVVLVDLGLPCLAVPFHLHQSGCGSAVHAHKSRLD